MSKQIKVTIKKLTTNGFINSGINEEFDATQFIAYSNEMKAHVLEIIALGKDEIRIELTDELWPGEKAVKF